MRLSVLLLSMMFIITVDASTNKKGDSLKQAIKTAESGTKLQAERLKIISENLANEHTTSTAPGSDPYRRKTIHAKNVYDKKSKAQLVKVKKYAEDHKTPFEVKYDPNHPAADVNGYVKTPNVNKEIERADALEAQRSYEANLSAIETIKSMQSKTLEILR